MKTEITVLSLNKTSHLQLLWVPGGYWTLLQTLLEAVTKSTEMTNFNSFRFLKSKGVNINWGGSYHNVENDSVL